VLRDTFHVLLRHRLITIMAIITAIDFEWLFAAPATEPRKAGGVVFEKLICRTSRNIPHYEGRRLLFQCSSHAGTSSSRTGFVNNYFTHDAQD
jgi:hypothetical protein